MMLRADDLATLSAAGAGALALAGCSLAGVEDGGLAPSCPDDEPGVICPWAGTGDAGFVDEGLHRLDSRLYSPQNLTFMSTGEAYIVDFNNHGVREVRDDGTLETVIGTHFVGDGPPDQSDLEPPGAPGTEVTLNHPTQFLEWEGSDRHLLVAWHNHKLRSYDPSTGKVVVVCGGSAGFDGDGPVEDALLNQPVGARFSDDGHLYISDQRNQRIRRIDTFEAGGTIETIAGTGEAGFAGDGGPAAEARVDFPAGGNPPPGGGLDFDEAGALYFADTLNNRLRRVDRDTYEIDTVLGDGDESVLNNPRDVERGPDGRLYIADEQNHRIVAFDPESGDSEVVAGTGEAGDAGDFGPATEARLREPGGVTFDGDGDLYIADTENHRIRKVTGGF